MKNISNTFRGKGLPDPILQAVPSPSTNAHAVLELLERCPEANKTDLVQIDDLAKTLGVAQVWIKDESTRMGLGSFKALGAAYVIAHMASIEGIDVSKMTFATASAGNHGLSVAAGAKAFGAKAAIYIADAVPESFAVRLKELGADVVRGGSSYDDSLRAAMDDAEKNGWFVLSDTSWPGYTDVPFRLMEGYTAFMAEAGEQMPVPPTHVFLQAGVGGLASAAAAMVRKMWGDSPHITVVEPEFAPALFACIEEGKFVSTDGPVSEMGRLDCKEASLIALKGLARDADEFMLISEGEGQAGAEAITNAGIPASTSGAAGLAGALVDAQLPSDAIVMCIVSEGPA